MSNALDVITPLQLEELKKLGLVVVHSKPTRNMYKACKAKLKQENCSLTWLELYNCMLGASINQQASEVDWSKYETPKITVTWDTTEPRVNTRVFASTPYQRDSYYYKLWENAVTQTKIAKPKLDKVKYIQPKFNTEPEYLKYIENLVKYLVTNELRHRNIK